MRRVRLPAHGPSNTTWSSATISVPSPPLWK